MKLFPDKDPVASAATHENSRQTGFTENWANALGLAMTEDLPVTSPLIPSTTESQRNQKLYEYQQSGAIPQGTANYFGGDTDGYARYARNVLGLEDIPTQEEYEENKLLEYAASREMSGKTAAQAGKMGVVGQIAGYAHAMALDPIYATSFLTGYGAAATVGQAALRVGVMEAGIETVAQFSKIPWKEEIGADYGAAQAMTEIAFAGLGAAALAALGKGVGGAVAKRFTAKDMTVGQAVEVFEKMAKKDPELEPILNTLRQADPEANLAKVMQADEAVDIRKANEGAKAGADTKGDMDMKAQEFEAAEEEIFTKRAGIEKEGADEGVPRGTPTPKEPSKGKKSKSDKKKARKARKAGGVKSPDTGKDTLSFSSELVVDEQAITRDMGQFLEDVGSHSFPGISPMASMRKMPPESQSNFLKMIVDEATRRGQMPEDGVMSARLMRRMAKLHQIKDIVAALDTASEAQTKFSKKFAKSIEGSVEGIDTSKKIKKTGAGAKAPSSESAKDIVIRMADSEEGVPRGTPKPKEPAIDTRHPLVKEADDMVVDYDNRISVMEDCF